MTLYIEEFLWRGRPPGSDQPLAYHVVLGSFGKDAFGRDGVTISDPMTPAQAEQMGFPLSTIVNGINAVTLQERDAAIAAQKSAESERDDAVSAKVAAEAERDQALASKAEAEAARVVGPGGLT